MVMMIKKKDCDKLYHTTNNSYYCDKGFADFKCGNCSEHVAMYWVCGCCFNTYETGVNCEKCMNKCKKCTVGTTCKKCRKEEDIIKEYIACSCDRSDDELYDDDKCERCNKFTYEYYERERECYYSYDLPICFNCYPRTRIQCIHSPGSEEFGRKIWCDPSLYEDVYDVKGAIED